MMELNFDYFFRQLKAGLNIDETRFYFRDDPEEEEHYLGYCRGYPKPYWIGYCDIKDGADFWTAEELVNAPIFNGKSLKDKWEYVCICGIEGLPLDDWFECMNHVD